MKPPLTRRSPRPQHPSDRQRGVTMLLVAVAMVVIIGMAALSIDVITLYLAREEAQRSADAAALAAARILSVSGLTGDPTNTTGNWSMVCGPDDGTHGLAARAAKAVVAQNAVGSLAASSINVTYSAPGGSSTADCTSLTNSTFGVNPLVTVQIQQTSLPTFFSRIWRTTGNSVSATATAEVFNPSNSTNAGFSTITPVQPRCVKPWAVPNEDPMYPVPSGSLYCNQSGGPGACQPLVSISTGAVNHPGISTGGTGVSGIIGETFWLNPDCRWSQSSCLTRINPPQANYNNGSGFMKGPPNLVLAPAQVGTTTALAVPSCASGDVLEEAIAGCDSAQNYSCGVPPPTGTNIVDLNRYPNASITDGVSCLIHQADTTNFTSLSGQDYLSNPPVLGTPASYPFDILAGSSNPLGAAVSGKPISSSSSIVSLPIYDQTTPITSGTTTAVTFVGFLQVFINAVDQYGNVNVTVLNVTGCGNDATGTAVAGTSPVPIRLITPP